MTPAFLVILKQVTGVHLCLWQDMTLTPCVVSKRHQCPLVCMMVYVCPYDHLRVRVTEIPDKGERLFSSVTTLFIDEGRTQEVKSHQLLQLPPQFQDVPEQVVEIILCRAQPIDGDVDWNPKVLFLFTPAKTNFLPYVSQQLLMYVCLS